MRRKRLGCRDAIDGSGDPIEGPRERRVGVLHAARREGAPRTRLRLLG